MAFTYQVAAIAMGLVAILVFACKEHEGPPLTVTWTGCSAVRAGEQGLVCVPGSDRRVTVVVPGPPEGISLYSGDERIRTASVTEVVGGARFDVPVSKPAEVLRVSRGDRRFSLFLGSDEVHPVIEEARALKKRGDLADMAQLLESRQGELDEGARALAEGLLARAALAEGRWEEAARTLARSSEAAHRTGQLSQALHDVFALTWIRTTKARDFERAKSLLSRAERWARPLPGEQPWVRYYRGQLHLEALDLRSALFDFEAAEQAAARLGDSHLSATCAELTAVVRLELGQIEEAVHGLSALSKSPLAPCARASVLNNLGWALISAGRHEDARAPLAEALDLRKDRCPSATGTSYVQLNLALAALGLGEADEAAAWLSRVEEVSALDARMRLWADEIEARIFELKGRADAALDRYAKLEARADAVGSHDAAWRARVGRARLLAVAGRRKEAIVVLEAAENDVSALLAGAPATEGLSRFARRHRRGTERLVALLREAGRLQDAHLAATEALHRPLLLLRRLDRVSRLEGARRVEWYESVGRYRAAQDRLLEHARKEWMVPRDRLERARAPAAQLRRRMERALEDALSVLGPAPRVRLPILRKGEALATVFPTRAGAVLFGRRAGRSTAKDVEEGAVEAEVARMVRGARRVLLDAPADLDVVLSVPSASVLPLDEGPGQTGGALVVANPTQNLPATETEAEAVRARLRKSRPPVALLQAGEATVGAVRRALEEAAVAHYAGHARYAGEGGWDSLLPLADGALSIADILTLERAPELVVLSGCETGRTAHGPAHTLGLAQAFLLSGSRAVVASVRRVTDQDAAVFMDAFYEDLETTGDPVQALHAAQSRVSAEVDAAAFRVFVRR